MSPNVLVIGVGLISLIMGSAPAPEEAVSNTVEVEQCKCDRCGADLVAKINRLEAELDRLSFTIIALSSEANEEYVESVKEQKIGPEVAVEVAPKPVQQKPQIQVEVAVEEQNDFVQFIVDNYGGQIWYHNRQPVGKSHLETHGFEIADLDGRSQNELGKLHGAIHTNSMAQLRKSYNGTGRMNHQKASVRRSTSQMAQSASKWSNSGTANVRRSEGYWQTRCVNGRCHRQWINR